MKEHRPYLTLHLDITNTSLNQPGEVQCPSISLPVNGASCEDFVVLLGNNPALTRGGGINDQSPNIKILKVPSGFPIKMDQKL